MEKRVQSLDERQAECLSTAMESCCNIVYPSLGMMEEVGEYTEKLLQSLRWDPAFQEIPQLESLMIAFADIGKRIGKYSKQARHTGVLPFTVVLTEEKRMELRKEVGDVNWMTDVADFFIVNEGQPASKWHLTAQDNADINHEKLLKRKAQNVIDGKGDNEREPVQ